MTETRVRPADDPFTGWRYWQVSPATLELGSVTQKQWRWRPGQVQRAVCVGGGHAAPAEGCACGIYGSKDLGALRDHGLCLAPGAPLVMGRVALWGKVVPDRDSYRAQYAYPTELSVVDGSVADEDLTSVVEGLAPYGVPVGTIPLDEAVGEVSGTILAFQAMSATTRTRG